MAVSVSMRKTLLLLAALLLTVPVFGAKHHHAHPAEHHAKNQNFPKKREKNPQFKQATGREHYKKPAEDHPKNPNLPKHQKRKHTHKS